MKKRNMPGASSKKSCLQNLSDNEILARWGILNQIIRENRSDPRVGEPIRQFKIIDAEVRKRKESVIGKPAPTIIGMDTLSLISKVYTNGAR